MRPVRRRSRGFTLIELLVALTILALMSLMAWYGLDGVIRSRAQSQSEADRLARMAAALDQLAADARAASDLGTEGVFMLADGLQITRNTTLADGRSETVVARWEVLDGALIRTLLPLPGNAAGAAANAANATNASAGNGTSTTPQSIAADSAGPTLVRLEAMTGVQGFDVRVYAAGRWWSRQDWAQARLENRLPAPLQGLGVRLQLPQGEVQRTLVLAGQ
ncbi:MAG TPA: prepilin-type N-terminal cleavage/methylation domain-containing protein [Burkholderiaceae bacterium]|nr:prepilin-type N-terminal cleavage/methylation domain-containing protein [Burkholderiaceae bacterium]